MAGVGVATWAAHLFAELLGGHVHHPEPLHRRQVKRAAVDGSPILASTILPAIALLLGRLDVLTDAIARIIAILVAIAQLLAIGAFVIRVAPARPMASWGFAAAVAGVGIAIVAVTVAVGPLTRPIGSPLE